MAEPKPWGYPIPKAFPDGVPYPGNDPILLKHHLQALDEAGYLNSNNPSLDEKIKPHDKESRAPPNQNPNPGTDAIHSILRREHWRGVSEAEYALLDPVLRLTSCFLGEPCIMPFFAGLRHLKVLDDVQGRALFKQPNLYWFDVHPENISSSEYTPANIEAWKFLAEEMGPSITFRLRDNIKNTHASTHAQSCISGKAPGKTTWTSEIRLDSSYLEVLKDNYPENMPYDDKIEKDPAKLRTIIHMATAILHELAHAVVNATVPRIFNEPEPFFQKGRISEVGLAFSQYLFDGVLNPNGPPKHTYCLYGVHMRDFPGAFHKSTAELQTPRDVGIQDEWRYAVHMDWIQKFMTTAFWEHEALRSEPNSAFKYQRTEYKAFKRVTYASEAASTTNPAVVASGAEDDWIEVTSKRKSKDNAGRGKKRSRG